MGYETTLMKTSRNGQAFIAQLRQLLVQPVGGDEPNNGIAVHPNEPRLGPMLVSRASPDDAAGCVPRSDRVNEPVPASHPSQRFRETVAQCHGLRVRVAAVASFV